MQDSPQSSRERSRQAVSWGELPKFCDGDYVLVAPNEFPVGEKLSLRWRGTRRIVKAISEYVFQIEDLRNRQLEDVHGTRLKYFRDSALDTEANMDHAIASETGMSVQRLMRLVDTEEGGLMLKIRGRRLPDSEDTLEPVSKIYEDVSQLLKKLLLR